MEILDLGTGRSVFTSRTGTARLWLTDSGPSLIRARKIGYLAETRVLGLSVLDTTPVTVVMTPSVHVLPQVVTSAHGNLRGPGDTIKVLEYNGFYDRRMFTGAPSRAFITRDQFKPWMIRLSDVTNISGRGVCWSNLYLNGQYLQPVPGERLQSLLPIDDVLAIELYDHNVEFPPEYNRSHSGSCLTLVWTR